MNKRNDNAEIVFCNYAEQIFGSQLLALTHLLKNRTCDEACLKTWFAGHKATAAGFVASPSFEKWLGFLIGTNLVVEDDGNYLPTEWAEDFAQFASDAGYSFEQEASNDKEL